MSTTWCCPRRTEMTPRERLTLSAWQKWRQHGRIPWKLVFAIIIVVTTTTIIVLQSLDEAPYTRAALSTWQFLLAPPEDSGFTGAKDEYGYRTVWHLYKLDTFISTLTNAMDTYYDVHNVTVDRFDYVYVEQIERLANGTIVKRQVPSNMTLAVETYAQGQEIFNLRNEFDDSTVTQVYELGQGDLGPFARNGTALADYVHTMKGASLSFLVQNYEFHTAYRTCFQWEISVVYEFTFRGRVDMTVHMSQDLCPSEVNVSWWERTDSAVVVLYFVTAVFAVVSQFLHLKAVVRSIQIYQEVKRATYQNDPSSAATAAAAILSDDNIAPPFTPHRLHRMVKWHHLGWREKLRFFNMWFFTATIGNVCNFVSACMSLNSLADLSSSRYSVSLSIVTGLGCMFSWISLVQYFESTTSYYVLITTLISGTPKVARFLVGVMPVFLAYAMFGVALFSPTTPRFATVDQACVTLFALLNGDVIHDVFDELYPAQPIISRIYLYTFISLFIYAVLNIFIAIVEDAFFASKAFQKQQQKNIAKLGLEKMDPLDLIDMVLPPSVPDVDGDDDDEDNGSGGGGGGGNSDHSHDDTLAHHHHHHQEKEKKKPTKKGTVVAPQSSMDEPLLGDDDNDSGGDGGLGVRQDGIGITSAMMASDESVEAIVRMVGELQETFNSEFLQYVSQTLHDSQLDTVYARRQQQSSLLLPQSVSAPSEREMKNVADVDNAFLRPPHDVKFYPCGDGQCAYCGIRRLYEQAVRGIQRDLPLLIDRMKS